MSGQKNRIVFFCPLIFLPGLAAAARPRWVASVLQTVQFFTACKNLEQKATEETQNDIEVATILRVWQVKSTTIFGHVGSEPTGKRRENDV